MLHRRDEEVRKARGIGFRSELGNRVDNSIVVWSLDRLPRMRWSIVTVALVLLGFSVGLLVFPFLYALGLLLTFAAILYMSGKIS